MDAERFVSSEVRMNPIGSEWGSLKIAQETKKSAAMENISPFLCTQLRMWRGKLGRGRGEGKI